MTNPLCKVLGIPVPRLEEAKDRPDANYYSLLIVALLERGEPITLEETARRFEDAGVAPAADALASLKKCKPGRAPIYRHGELYALDPHDDETDFWVFRLGLRPAKMPRLRVVREEPEPLPSTDTAITVALLDETWRGGIPSGWSRQRIAICVLDAHGGVLPAERVCEFVAARARWRRLSIESAEYWRRGAPVRARDDGRWHLDRDHPAVASARRAVRERLETVRRQAESRLDPAVISATQKHFQRKREANSKRLASMRRVLIHTFPATTPAAVVLLDVNRHEITTSLGDEIASVGERLANYDALAAVDVRGVLRTLGFEAGERRLAELGPPQKSMRINRQGRTLKITLPMLVQGSCGISRPFGDAKVLRRYLRDHQIARLRSRLEADSKSLFALYQYGRLHGTVRLRWGFLDERIPAPWVHRDEPGLIELMNQALDLGSSLEIVRGHAPSWADPWSRVERVHVVRGEHRWNHRLVAADGFVIDDRDIQLARLP